MKFINKDNRLFFVMAGLAVCSAIAGLVVAKFFVLDQQSSAAVITCDGEKSDDYECWRSRFQQIIKTGEPKQALDDARKQQETNTFIQINCHEIAHIIGRASGKKYTDVAEAFTKGDDFCASGYYHGVIQAIADDIGAEGIATKINDICAPLRESGKYLLDHYNCVHGLGHGIMAINANELYVSLEVCDRLNDLWEQESCYSGVFMENGLAGADPTHHTKYLKADDPLYPCTEVDDKYKKMCYFLQTDHALRVLSADFSRVFQLCGGLENETYQIMCYESLGRNASSYAQYDPQQTKQNCELGSDFISREHCVIAAAKDFVWYFHSLSQATSFCKVLLPELKGPCDRSAEDYFRLL